MDESGREGEQEENKKKTKTKSCGKRKGAISNSRFKASEQVQVSAGNTRLSLRANTHSKAVLYR